MASERAPKNKEDLKEWMSFVKADSHVLRQYPELFFQQAANQSNSSTLAVAARRRWERGAHDRPWIDWVNKPRGRDACILTLVGHSPKLARPALGQAVVRSCTFSPDGGTISLSLAVRANNVVIDVKDSGAGVPVEDGERIFDWFFQGRVPSAGRMKGSGLGLAIARECCVAHGGSIEMLESAPGAHFRVEIPLRPAAGAA